ncbi:flagellar FlhE [Alcanivorax sp. N3-2A]|nr:flagellar FlhE [Alcanivorax sp. N3-2A]|tara:strand:+ start:5600 stop:5992 length:393 start_codon:yes stop_codon:yes gene_type:complete
MAGALTRWGIAALGLMPVLATAAPGSWVAEVPALRVAVVGRAVYSEAVTPPPGAGVPHRIGWRYTSAGHRRLDAWLCQRQHCVPLQGERGRLAAPRGWRADTPLRFRFRLPPGETRAVQVNGLRISLEWR